MITCSQTMKIPWGDEQECPGFLLQPSHWLTSREDQLLPFVLAGWFSQNYDSDVMLSS